MKQKKSKFQTRLDEIVAQRKKEETQSTEGATAPKVRLHTEEIPIRRGDSPTSIIAQPVPLPADREWISLEYGDEKPPYYSPIDIWDGKELYENWHRVSNGQYDYYCNQRDNRIVRHVTHWAKLPGVKYNPYQPMTEDDIPKYSQRNMIELINELEEFITVPLFNNEDFKNHQYEAGMYDAIKTVKRMTGIKKV